MALALRVVFVLSVMAGTVFQFPTLLPAAIITATEDATKFGTLDQAVTNCPDVNCGPTAAVNSFVYLQNSYPGIYSTPLVPTTHGMMPTSDEQKAVANDLGTNFMKNCCGTSMNGTLIEDFILGKRDYLESKDRGATVYAAQMNFAWRTDPAGGTHPGTAKPAFVQDNTVPTLAFLSTELKAKEDVEAFLFSSGNGKEFNHYITLTGLSYDDTTNKGTMSFVDPLGGTRGTANLTGLIGGFIQTDYSLGGFNAEIVHAVAESPIPEPATWFLLLSGLAGLTLRRRRLGR